MNIDTTILDGLVVAAVSGEIDSHTAPEAQSQLVPLIEKGDLILDMENITFLSSAGLRILLVIYRQAETINHKIALAGLNDTVKDTMEITGFLKFFTVCSNKEEALEALKGS
jgi:anti-sigma B factor antagonist